MQDLNSIRTKLNDELFQTTQETCLCLCRVQDITKKSKEKTYILCACIYQKPDPQPSLHLVRLGEKANDIPKKKTTIILRDVKTVDFNSLNVDKRSSSTNTFDLRTSDREYSLLVMNAEEKKRISKQFEKNQRSLFEK